jgi:predicted nucleic acid-binding protein
MIAEAFLDTNVLLYSEDLSHGQEFETLRIVNPFR